MRAYWKAQAGKPGASLEVTENTVDSGPTGDMTVRTDGYYVHKEFPPFGIGTSSPCLTRRGPYLP